MSLPLAEAEYRSQAEHARKVDLAWAVAIAIAQMDPEGRNDLACYLQALNEAKANNDEGAQKYALDGIKEVFFPQSDAGDCDIDRWSASAGAVAPEAQRAWKDRDDENARFMRRYQELKAAAGLQTQRQVADACGLSINTVNAIETQKVKPQARTLQKLAKGLGVSVQELLSA